VRRLSLVTLYLLLLWAPLASGAYRGWPLAVVQLLTVLGLLFWFLGSVAERRLVWRRTALDGPLALLIALVLVQLALGNQSLVDWALAPPGPDLARPAELPATFLALGTVSPGETARSLLLLLTYAGVYVLVVNLVRERRSLGYLVRTLVVAGSALAFLGLLDYLSGPGGLIWWRDSSTGARRLFGTFANPTHFGAWLAMLVCLGLGDLLARRSRREPSDAPAEEAVRRYLLFLGVSLMALALVFTMSRGGVLSLLLTVVTLAVLMAWLGLTRWSLVLVGALGAVTIGAGAWLGLEPFMARVRQASPDYGFRWIQSLTTLPMLLTFPVFGVGLGAYKDIYFRYQPSALKPGEFYYPYAHNDLLQFAVETGLIGTALGLLAVWRVGRDLVGAHLLGLGRCPVSGSDGEVGRRRDPVSVGTALGAIGGVVALGVHSAFDFGARIPANGILAAACLAIATVALHARFGVEGTQPLDAIRVRPLGPGRVFPLAAAAIAMAVAVALVPLIVRPALVEAGLAAGSPRPAGLARVEEALALAPRDAPRAVRLLEGAIEDLRAAIALTPSDPFLHERLGWAHGTLASIESTRSAEHRPRAITHLQRAIALAPENPFLRRSLAAVAVTPPEPLLGVGLRAAGEAVRRDPGLLADLVERFLLLGLDDAQWISLAADSPAALLQLASLLEARGFFVPSGAAYGQAVARLPVDLQPLARWMLARLRLREGNHGAALGELAVALSSDPENPELHLARAHALAIQGAPEALTAHRTAVTKAEQAGNLARGGLPFPAPSPPIARLIAERMGEPGPVTPLRYRRALAQHLMLRKLWVEALPAWERVVAETPRDPAAHFARGVALGELGAWDRAHEAYGRAVALDGRTVRFRLGLARSLWQTGRYVQAVGEWLAITRQEPANLEARLALAEAYARMGERDEATRTYREIRHQAPGHPEAQRGLARLERFP